MTGQRDAAADRDASLLRDKNPEAAPRRARPGSWGITFACALVFLVVYVVHMALLPFVLAAGIAFVAEPLIAFLQPRFGGHRWIPAMLFFLLLLGLGGLVAYWIGRVAVQDVSQLAKDGPHMLHDLAGKLVGQNGLSLFGTTYTADSLTDRITKAAGSAMGPGAVTTVGSLGIGVLLGGFLTLVLIPYFLVSGPRVSQGLVWLIPPERRSSVQRLLPELVPAMRRYFVGVAVVVTFTAVVAYLGFGLLFALPHALLLSIAVGLLEIIPALGPFASMVLVGLSALQEHSPTVIALLIAYAVFLRLAIDNGVGPIVLGKSVKLHPVAIMFAFVCGAAFLGIIGLLLAVPASACLIIVLDRYYAEPVEVKPG